MEDINFLKNTGLLKVNYKGESVPAAAGIIFVIGGTILWAVMLLTAGSIIILKRLIFLTVITGCAGLVDDIQGTKKFRGFNGHINALINGKLTTGIIKAVAIFFASLIVVFTSETNSYIIDTGVLILMSHFHNLLDLRPGRTIKFFTIYTLIIIIIYPVVSIYLTPIFFIIIFYAYFDLKAKVMLGDTGSYTLGIISGLITINAVSQLYKFFILIFLLIMTVLSEKYSFSTYIKKNKVLNWIDMLGRKI